MAYFVETLLDAKPLSVGVIDKEVISPIDARGHDCTLLVLTNTSTTETFNGTAYSSPNGTSQWADVLDDAFQGIPPGATRRMKLESKEHLFVKVIGSYLGAPDVLRRTIVRLRGAARRG